MGSSCVCCSVTPLLLKTKCIYLFIYFWLCWVFVAMHGLSLVVVSRSLFVVVFRLLVAVASRCRARALGRAGFSNWWCMGLVALRHVGSSWTRARTRVSCIGRRILNHCATRKPSLTFNKILWQSFHVIYILHCHLNGTKVSCRMHTASSI